MSSRKRYLLIGLALLVAVLLVLAFRPQPVPVTLATVQRGPLEVTVEQEGQTRVRERYVISAPVSAYAPRLALEVGDPVQAGQRLLVLQPVPSTPLDARARAQAEARAAQAEAALRAERSRLGAAQAANDLAQAEYQRLSTLFERGDISRSALDQAQARAEQTAAELRAARFAVDVARQELEAARAALQMSGATGAATEEVPVVSPVTGQVLAIEEKSGGIVAAGRPLLTVGDPGALEIAVDVLSNDAVRIRPGTEVVFERWGGEPLEGRVRTVEPSGFTKISALGVEEQRVFVIADFTSPREQWEALGDGYRVEASFILWRGENVLKVPNSALFREGDDWAAFVAEEGTAEKRVVRIGHRGELETEVLEGLAAGERVITHPDDAVAEGVRIEPRQS